MYLVRAFVRSFAPPSFDILFPPPPPSVFTDLSFSSTSAFPSTKLLASCKFFHRELFQILGSSAGDIRRLAILLEFLSHRQFDALIVWSYFGDLSQNHRRYCANISFSLPPILYPRLAISHVPLLGFNHIRTSSPISYFLAHNPSPHKRKHLILALKSTAIRPVASSCLTAFRLPFEYSRFPKVLNYNGCQAYFF